MAGLELWGSGNRLARKVGDLDAEHALAGRSLQRR
jgi:hypothetical protein